MNLIQKNQLGREVVEFSLDEFQQIYELKNVVEAVGAMKGALNAKEEEMARIQKVLGQRELKVFENLQGPSQGKYDYEIPKS